MRTACLLASCAACVALAVALLAVATHCRPAHAPRATPVPRATPCNAGDWFYAGSCVRPVLRPETYDGARRGCGALGMGLFFLGPPDVRLVQMFQRPFWVADGSDWNMRITTFACDRDPAPEGTARTLDAHHCHTPHKSTRLPYLCATRT